MAHILFADTNDSGLATIDRALLLGHRVTLLRGASRQLYTVDDRVRELFARCRVVGLPVTSDAGPVTAALDGVHRRDPVDAVVCQVESATEAAAAACHRLGLRFAAPAAVRAARDKARCREALRAAGLRSARHALVHDEAAAAAAADRIGYPVVVKPVSGMDSLFARRADEAGAVRAAAREALAGAGREPAQIRDQLGRGVLVEECLAGPLVSAELGVLDGRAYRFMLSGRSRARENECVELGAVMPSPLGAAGTARCFGYAEEVCRVLGLDFGVFHIEMIVTADGPALVEVNPRVMGGVMTSLYRRLTGTDFADHVLDLALGRPPAVPGHEPGRTLAVRKVMPLAPARLPERVDLAWTGSKEWRIVDRWDYGIGPGRDVAAGQVLARYVVEGDGWTDAARRGDRLLEGIERSLGVPVFHAGSGDVPARHEGAGERV